MCTSTHDAVQRDAVQRGIDRERVGMGAAPVVPPRSLDPRRQLKSSPHARADRGRGRLGCDRASAAGQTCGAADASGEQRHRHTASAAHGLCSRRTSRQHDGGDVQTRRWQSDSDLLRRRRGDRGEHDSDGLHPRHGDSMGFCRLKPSWLRFSFGDAAPLSHRLDCKPAPASSCRHK
jgi:hypothetical protein